MRTSRIIVAIFVVSFAIAGTIDALLGAADEFLSPTYGLHTLLIAILGFAWCKADVKENRLEMPRGSPILCALILPIGVPIHLFRTRPVRRASIGVLKGVGFFFVAIISYELAATVVETVAA